MGIPLKDAVVTRTTVVPLELVLLVSFLSSAGEVAAMTWSIWRPLEAKSSELPPSDDGLALLDLVVVLPFTTWVAIAAALEDSPKEAAIIVRFSAAAGATSASFEADPW